MINNAYHRYPNSIPFHQSPKSLKTDSQAPKAINVALVSDFYYPFVGGVQIHIKQLASNLTTNDKIGTIIVITHKYDNIDKLAYTGVQTTHGFKVYYLNIHYNKQYQITYPTFIFNFKTIVSILEQQRIEIVHCHQSGSPLSLQLVFFAKILGLRVILTEHSLYGFRSVSDICFNQVSRLFLGLCDHVIAVSQTTRNNVILRAEVSPSKVTVIPNGVSDVSHIRNKIAGRKESSQWKKEYVVKIISVGRMMYRRGTDLLIQIIPELCSRHKNIEILVVGDGVKRRALQKIIEIYQLQNQVKLLGIISEHEALLEKMGQCDIFLNTPLTESFGIALAEAAMLGLFCVSTNVGGVEEAVPQQLLISTRPDPQHLIEVLSKVITRISLQHLQTLNKTTSTHYQSTNPLPFQYRWQNVSDRTIQLYQHILFTPSKSTKQHIYTIVKNGNLLEIVFGFLAIGLIIYYHILLGNM